MGKAARGLVMCGFLCFLSGFPADTKAQAPEEEDQPTILEEIVVTAEKRERDLQEVPLAITAFTQDEIELARITEIDDVADSTPSLYFETLGITRPFIFLRGTGTGAFDIGSDPSIGIFLDEIYLPRFTGITFDLFDFERIEVLKGPQGALFGRNTAGGAISLVTQKPDSDAGGRLSLGLGDYDLVTGRISSGGSMGQAGFYRLSAGFSQRDGYVENLLTNTDHNDAGSMGVRAQMQFSRDRSDALVTVDWSRDDLNAWAETNVTDGVFLLFPPLAGTFPTSDDPYRQFYDTDGFQERDNGGVSLRWVWTGDKTSLTSLTSWRTNDLLELHDLDSSAAATLDRFADEDSDAFSQELRLASESESLSWMAGLYYFRDDAYRLERWDVGADNVLARVFNAGRGYSTFDSHEVDTESTAVFGQIDLSLGDRVQLSLGARYSTDDKRSRRDARAEGVAFTPLLPAPYTIETERDWSSFDPTLALHYAPREDNLLYFRYSEGFKSGGFQPTLPANASVASSIFDPEEVQSFEVGWKSMLAGHRLRLNVAAFHVSYDNLQFLAATDEGPGGAPIVVITNAAESSTDGLELELVARPSSGLELRLGYSYLDAVLDQYVDGAGNDQSGNRIIRSPEHQMNAAVQYFRSIGTSSVLTLRADWSRQTEMFFDPANTEIVSQPAFSLINARIGLEPQAGRWSLALWGKNLADEDHCQNIIVLTNGTLGLCTPDAPRTWGLSMGWKFGD